MLCRITKEKIIIQKIQKIYKKETNIQDRTDLTTLPQQEEVRFGNQQKPTALISCWFLLFIYVLKKIINK